MWMKNRLFYSPTNGFPCAFSDNHMFKLVLSLCYVMITSCLQMHEKNHLHRQNNVILAEKIVFFLAKYVSFLRNTGQKLTDYYKSAHKFCLQQVRGENMTGCDCRESPRLSSQRIALEKLKSLGDRFALHVIFAMKLQSTWDRKPQ